MADDKPTDGFYDMLGGINQKASVYAVGRAQFLDIRNMDFDVPNALSKRPGSTQAVTAGTSGPITSIFEFIKLSGESYVIAGSDTAMFYLAVNTYTLLDSNWNNGQPADVLTFVNKAWMANGQKYKWWDGTSLMQVGLPCPKTAISSVIDGTPGASFFYVAGVTFTASVANPRQYTGIYAAYGYVRSDGYFGPINFYSNARWISTRLPASGTSGDLMGQTATPYILNGFTSPTGFGITAIAIYLAQDTYLNTAGSNFAPPGPGDNGPISFIGYTLLPSADTSRFKLFTLIPTSSTAFTLVIPVNLASSQSFAPSFTGMEFCWFDTNTPKYIEVNQNVMWMAGLSQSPSVLWFSELGKPENLEPEYNFEVRTNDGDRIMATKAYGNQLLVLKENSFHKVVGDNPGNFQLVELSQQFGCLSNKAVIEYKESLVWLDVRGIVMFNGASWELISTPVEDHFRRMNIAAAKEKACAVHYKYRNQIWFGIPLDNSTVNNITIVWDYLIDAWTFFDGFNASSAAYVKGYLNRPTVWRGDYSGLIHYHGEVFYGDNGQGITCTATPHWDKVKPNETWLWRRLFLDVAVQSGLTGRVTGKVLSNYDTTTVQATYAIYQNEFQSRAEMGVQAKSATTEWAHYSASLPLLINGFSWGKKFLRNV